MLHGPCSARFACWRNDKCKYGFPKPFSEHKMLVDGEYPIYKRRNNDSQFVKGSTIFTNKDVVTYSPFLLMRYECHINVEIVVSVKAMKYIYKYICKGEDRAVLSLESKDETLDFVNGRYIGPCEAITRMAIHTEGSQLFYFRDEHGTRSQVEAGTAGKTTLTGYFKLNSENAVSNGQPAQSLFYSDIPKYFWWNKKRKEWEPRKKKILAVGRVYFARFTEGERYYLCLLLMNRKGAISFGDLRTANGTQHSTYQDAALASGLLLSDKHYHDCLTEATLWMSGKRLGKLYIIMLCNSPPADPKTLLDNHIEDLSDDCGHLLCHTYSIDEPSETLSQNLAKYFINEEMKEVGKSLNDYGIDMTDMEFDFISSFSEEPCSIDDGIYKKMLGQLTRPQKKIYQEVEKAVVSKEQLLCFVDGPGGSGKNILLNTIIGSLRNQGIVIEAVSSSGIAALLLHGGSTAHSAFKIPLTITQHSTCNWLHHHKLQIHLKSVQLIVWDEVSMKNRYAVEAVDRSLQDLFKTKQSFGGVSMVFSGDFWQTLPVIRHGSMENQLAASFKSLKIFTLTENLRLEPDTTNHMQTSYASWLLKLGDGAPQCRHIERVLVDGIKCFQSPNKMWVQIKAVLFVYDELVSMTSNGSIKDKINYFKSRILLAPLNANVKEFNKLLLDQLKSEEYISYSIDRLAGDEAHAVPEEVLNSLSKPGFPDHKIHLKLGVPLLLLCNLRIQSGLCNGTRLLLIAIQPNVLKCKHMDGPNQGKKVLIPKIKLLYEDMGTSSL
ncbi:hypothetical protein O181_014564 [Austropuccinia psidii MF-1]|uniref:ATP-dependent DNA helicase n=1 Tax=Austropuccinia psidii MF-1 TaxID=1389203 RepID=A0A9Q3GPZ1_9BASI|nr:hypothetical protein [Austropuccinia psidii MF-1]